MNAKQIDILISFIISSRQSISNNQMTKKGKKQLMSSAPWRGDDTEEFEDAKLKLTSQPGATSTMHVPRTKSNHHHHHDNSLEIDPELRYSFQRNFQVFLFLITQLKQIIIMKLSPAVGLALLKYIRLFIYLFIVNGKIFFVWNISSCWAQEREFHVHALSFID